MKAILLLLICLILAIRGQPPNKQEVQSEAYNIMRKHLYDKPYEPTKREEYTKEIAEDIKDYMGQKYPDMMCDVHLFLLDSKSPCVWSTRTSYYPDYDAQANVQYLDDNWDCVAFMYMYDKKKRETSCEVPTFNSKTEKIKEIANKEMEETLSGTTEFNNNNAQDQAEQIAEDVKKELEKELPSHSYGVTVCMTSSNTSISGVSSYYGMTARDGVTSAVYKNPGYWCAVYVNGVQNA